jgi:hypothetical protein
VSLAVELDHDGPPRGGVCVRWVREEFRWSCD